MNRHRSSEQSTADPLTVCYLDDDQLLLDLQADVAAKRETVELVPTADADRAKALLDDREFDCVIVSGGRTNPTAGEFGRDIYETYPDVTLILYTWEPQDAVDETDAFDAVVRKRAGAEETIRLLDRVSRLDN